MSGIILLVILAIWTVIVTKLTAFFTSKVHAGIKKKVLSVIIFALLFSAPVADEIIGGFQFRALCREGTKIVFDADKAKDKTVQLKNVPDRIIDKVIPIREMTWDWVDIKTGQTYIKYKYFYAKGGWLSRLISFPQGSPPYTFDRFCGSNEDALFKKMNISKDVNKYYGE